MQSGDGQTDLNVDVQRNVTEIQLVVKRPRGGRGPDDGGGGGSAGPKPQNEKGSG